MYDPFAGLEIDIQEVRYVTLRREWREETPHADPFSRLYYIQGGEGRLTLDGTRHSLAAGRFYLLPARHALQHHPSPGLELHYIHLAARVRAGLPLFEFVRCPVAYPAPDPDAARRRVERLGHFFARAGLADGVAAQGLVRSLLVPFLAGGRIACSAERVSGRARFREVLEYIDAHLDQPLRVPALAALLHLHPTYFANQFARQVGLSPREYIKRRRVERAQLLLGSTGEPLKGVARRVGLRDVCYFARVFKASTGVTPGAYRAQRQALGC